MAVRPDDVTNPSEAAMVFRPAAKVMTLERLGALHATRLSFARTLVRRMAREGWRIRRQRFQVDARGVGVAAYGVDTPAGQLSFVAFAEHLEPEERTDRVIATRWDATFALSEGSVDDAALARLAANVPRQEAGRVSERELVLSRANRSVRLFDHVVDALARGLQPDAAQLAAVGYLMRTTAVYGNGKFGLSDLERLQDGGIFRLPFQAEMFAVYMARHFSIQMVEHMARVRGGERAVPLAPELCRALGVGNATGLGMAPFLATHPRLLDRWIRVRETALARVRALAHASPRQRQRFPVLLRRAIEHVAQWHTDDERQAARIQVLRRELDELARGWLPRGEALLCGMRPFDALFRALEDRVSAEAEELLASLLIELGEDEVDPLEEDTGVEEDEFTRPSMDLAALVALIERAYGWALQVDFDDPASRHRFWYVSEDKEEPRLGERGVDPGDELEMRIDIARQVHELHTALGTLNAGDLTRSVAWWLLREPRWRGIVRRVQSLAELPYAEVRGNVLDARCVPVDLLRCKLATFGATGFDPKSDRWTRITLFQGAPAVAELGGADADDWWMPVTPSTSVQRY